MPTQIFDAKKFKELVPRAEEIRVARSDGKTKLKLRTKRMLYTYVTTDEEAEKLLKGIDKPVVDLTEKPKKEAEEKEEKEVLKEEKKEEAEEERVEEEPKEVKKKKPRKKASKGKQKKEKAEE